MASGWMMRACARRRASAAAASAVASSGYPIAIRSAIVAFLLGVRILPGPIHQSACRAAPPPAGEIGRSAQLRQVSADLAEIAQPCFVRGAGPEQDQPDNGDRRPAG